MFITKKHILDIYTKLSPNIFSQDIETINKLGSMPKNDSNQVANAFKH